MKTKKFYKMPSVKVIQIESSAILVESDPTKPRALRLNLDEIEEEGYAE